LRTAEVDDQQNGAQHHQREGDVVSEPGDRPVALVTDQVDQRADEVGPCRDAAEEEVQDHPHPPFGRGDDTSIHASLLLLERTMDDGRWTMALPPIVYRLSSIVYQASPSESAPSWPDAPSGCSWLTRRTRNENSAARPIASALPTLSSDEGSTDREGSFGLLGRP